LPGRQARQSPRLVKRFSAVAHGSSRPTLDIAARNREDEPSAASNTPTRTAGGRIAESLCFDGPRPKQAVCKLPHSLFRYILEVSWLHQLLLSALTAAVFLLEIVPLELQRRAVNDLVKHRAYNFIIILCALYAGVVFVQGGTKLALNVYRGWVGERDKRDLRRRILSAVERDRKSTRLNSSHP